MGGRSKCGECGEAVAAEVAEVHVRKHLGYAPFFCLICQSHFFTRDSLGSHWRGRHPGKDLKVVEDPDDAQEERLAKALAKLLGRSRLPVAPSSTSRRAKAVPLSPSPPPTPVSTSRFGRQRRPANAPADETPRSRSQAQPPTQRSSRASNRSRGRQGSPLVSDDVPARSLSPASFPTSPKPVVRIARLKPSLVSRFTPSRAAPSRATASRVVASPVADSPAKEVAATPRRASGRKRLPPPDSPPARPPPKRRPVATVRPAAPARKSPSPKKAPAAEDEEGEEEPEPHTNLLLTGVTPPTQTVRASLAAKPADLSSEAENGEGKEAGKLKAEVKREPRGDRFCRLCAVDLPDNRTEQEHVILKHLEGNALKCSVCPVSAKWNPSKIRSHIKEEHGGEAEVIDLRREKEPRVTELMGQAFGIGLRLAARARATKPQDAVKEALALEAMLGGQQPAKTGAAAAPGTFLLRPDQFAKPPAPSPTPAPANSSCTDSDIVTCF